MKAIYTERLQEVVSAYEKGTITLEEAVDKLHDIYTEVRENMRETFRNINHAVPSDMLRWITRAYTKALNEVL